VELVLVLAVFIVFDIVAWIWGFDSRVTVEDDRSINRLPRRSI